MKLITRDTDYAIRAVCFIAKAKRRISVQDLVGELRIPRPFLRKILQALNKKRILTSHKGQGGGFDLAIAPGKISLLSLVRIFQGPLKFNVCTFRRKICSDVRLCKVRKKIDKIQEYVSEELRRVTVASLIKKKKVI